MTERRDDPTVEWLDDVAAAVEVVVPSAGWHALVARLTDQQRRDVGQVLAGIRRERSLEDSDAVIERLHPRRSVPGHAGEFTPPPGRSGGSAS